MHHYRFRVYLFDSAEIRKVLPREHARENLVHHYRFHVYLFDSAGICAATSFTFIFFQCYYVNEFWCSHKQKTAHRTVFVF